MRALIRFEIELSDLEDLAHVEREAKSIRETYFKPDEEINLSVSVLGSEDSDEGLSEYRYNEDGTFTVA